MPYAEPGRRAIPDTRDLSNMAGKKSIQGKQTLDNAC